MASTVVYKSKKEEDVKTTDRGNSMCSYIWREKKDTFNESSKTFIYLFNVNFLKEKFLHHASKLYIWFLILFSKLNLFIFI